MLCGPHLSSHLPLFTGSPLSAIYLPDVVLCEPKGAGKHAGKFYLHTKSRQFKLVPP